MNAHRLRLLYHLQRSSLAPISNCFGLDRGQAIDRFYIEAFLESCRNDIHGRVLEIGDRFYTSKFGGDRVVASDILHAVDGNQDATLIGDLATGSGIPRDYFDCIILTQTLLCIYDVSKAVSNAYAALAPGGTVLATFPGISQISRYDMDRWGDYWRFTNASAQRLFQDVFGNQNVHVETFGNVFVACAFLYGFALHELSCSDLSWHDPNYQVLIAVRAVRNPQNV